MKTGCLRMNVRSFRLKVGYFKLFIVNKQSVNCTINKYEHPDLRCKFPITATKNLNINIKNLIYVLENLISASKHSIAVNQLTPFAVMFD